MSARDREPCTNAINSEYIRSIEDLRHRVVRARVIEEGEKMTRESVDLDKMDVREVKSADE